jgi:hypothetical protein
LKKVINIFAARNFRLGMIEKVIKFILDLSPLSASRSELIEMEKCRIYILVRINKISKHDYRKIISVHNYKREID